MSDGEPTEAQVRWWKARWRYRFAIIADMLILVVLWIGFLLAGYREANICILGIGVDVFSLQSFRGSIHERHYPIIWRATFSGIAAFCGMILLLALLGSEEDMRWAVWSLPWFALQIPILIFSYRAAVACERTGEHRR